jgi:hypothetical protein
MAVDLISGLGGTAWAIFMVRFFLYQDPPLPICDKIREKFPTRIKT